MPPCCVSCRACEKSITDGPICYHVVLVVVPSCENGITEAPICHNVVLVVVPSCEMVISTGVGEASSVGAGRCAYRICFQPSPLTSLTAKSERST